MKELLTAYETGVPIPPLRERVIPLGDIDAAYAMQVAQKEHWLAQGRRLVGAKIGLTNKAVQSVFGVFQPDFGILFADMAVPDGDIVDLKRLIQPRVEAEVAFVMGSDLPHAEVTSVDVMRATDYVLPAIEIVDSRITGWDISIVDTVADNASSGMYALGTTPTPLSKVDLRMCGMVLEHLGEPISVGAGAACLGNPLNAVTWLASTLARMGSPLRAGDVVLSGALGPMVSVTPGAMYEARISGMGSVRVGFSHDLPGAARVTAASPSGDAEVAAASPSGDAEVAAVSPSGDAEVAAVSPSGDAKRATVSPVADVEVAAASPSAGAGIGAGQGSARTDEEAKQ